MAHYDYNVSPVEEHIITQQSKQITTLEKQLAEANARAEQAEKERDALREALINADLHVREQQMLVLECIRRGEAGKPLDFNRLREYIRRHPPSPLRSQSLAGGSNDGSDSKNSLRYCCLSCTGQNRIHPCKYPAKDVCHDSE